MDTNGMETNSMETDSDAPFANDDLQDPRETVTNDAVAGETVLPGTGEGNDGPTGGSPAEGEPKSDENDLADEEIDLTETGADS